MQESPATALELLKQLGLGAIGIGALWLVLKYKPWDKRNGGVELAAHHIQRIDAINEKVITIDARMDVLWGFFLRRSISEGLAAGTLTRESPLRANVQILDRHHEVVDGIKRWYEAEGKGLGDLELFIELERRFNVELHAICEQEKMMDGACLAALLFILRPDAPLFRQYDAKTWHAVP